MTAVSSGPRNAFGPLRRARFKRRTSSATLRSSHLSLLIATALEQSRVALADELATVREGHVERDDEMAIARGVQRAGGRVPALDESGEGHRGELALGVGLVEPRPDRRALRGAFSHGQRVQELEAPGLGQDPDETR